MELCLELLKGLNMNASKPLSAMLVNGTTSTVLLSSKSPTAMLQSKDIVISLPPISNTIADALNDSMYIKDIKNRTLWIAIIQHTEKPCRR